MIVSLLTDSQTGSVSDPPLRRVARRADGALSAALSATPLRSIGKVSYAIYLYHLPIYYLLLNYAPGRSHYFYGAVVLAASLLAAACSWKLLESPINHGIALGGRILARVNRGRHDRDPGPVPDVPVARTTESTSRVGGTARRIQVDTAAWPAPRHWSIKRSPPTLCGARLRTRSPTCRGDGVSPAVEQAPRGAAYLAASDQEQTAAGVYAGSISQLERWLPDSDPGSGL